MSEARDSWLDISGNDMRKSRGKREELSGGKMEVEQKGRAHGRDRGSTRSRVTVIVILQSPALGLSSSTFTNTFSPMRLVWVFFLMVLVCSACNRNDFKSKSGLGWHRRKCKSVVPAAKAMFEKRDQRLRERKLREEKEKKEKEQQDMHEMEVEEGNSDDQVCCTLFQAEELPNRLYHLIRCR